MAQQNSIVYFDGNFLPESAVSVSPRCRGLHYGDGVFETMRSYGGVIFRCGAHIHRMIQGLGVLGITADLPSPDSLQSAPEVLLRENRLTGAVVKTIAFRSGGAGALPPENASAHILMTAAPFNESRKRECEKGITAQVVSIRRNESTPLAYIKSLNYLDNILGRMQADRAGAGEALFLNTNGFLTEGATANIFFSKGGSLFTPSAETGILPGITRQAVCEIAGRENIPLTEGAFTADDIVHADEAFLTNSVLEIIPLVSVNGSHIGNGCPGPLTAQLMTLYAELVVQETARQG